jgi:FMN phosphatase YigB (HAD superfamily)
VILASVWGGTRTSVRPRSPCTQQAQLVAGLGHVTDVLRRSPGQDIGWYKPAWRNFEALAEEVDRLGVAPGKLLHVAHSLCHDHLPAMRAGLPTVWISRGHARPEWGATSAHRSAGWRTTPVIRGLTA